MITGRPVIKIEITAAIDLCIERGYTTKSIKISGVSAPSTPNFVTGIKQKTATNTKTKTKNMTKSTASTLHTCLQSSDIIVNDVDPS